LLFNLASERRPLVVLEGGRWIRTNVSKVKKINAFYRSYQPIELIQISITSAQARAINYFKKRFWEEPNVSLSNVAEWILNLALQHPETIDAWVYRFTLYCDAEGIDQKELLSDALACHKKYRRMKMNAGHPPSTGATN
jgi:hypothetical protein